MGADGSALTPTPFIQPPLMDVLENKSEEPMSLRSMLRFARENVSECSAGAGADTAGVD